MAFLERTSASTAILVQALTSVCPTLYDSVKALGDDPSTIKP